MALMILSGLLLFILLYRISTYEKTVVSYNSYVSASIAMVSSLDEIEKNYYKYFVTTGIHHDERSLIDGEFDNIHASLDRVARNGIYDANIDTNNVSMIVKITDDLAMQMQEETTYDEKAIVATIGDIEKLKSLVSQIRQDSFVVIRETNVKSGFLNNIMVGYDIFMLIVIFIIVDRQLLKPLKNFSGILDARLANNEMSPPKIEMGMRHELGIFAEKLNLFTERLSMITELNSKIYAQRDFDEVIDFVFRACKPFLPYNRFAIAIISEDGKYIRALRARADYTVLLGRNYQESLSKSSIADVIRSRKIRIINDLEAYLAAHPSSESTKIILKEGIRASMTVPLLVDQQVIGVIFFSSKYKDVYNDAHMQFVDSLTTALAIAFEKSFVFDDLILASVKGFAKIVESKDYVTGNHIDRMSIYAKFVTECLYNDSLYVQQIDESYIDKILKFSPLHDIGKVGISETVLNKPGKLTSEEFDVIKQHTLIGYDVLVNMTAGMYVDRSDYFKIAREIVKSHHEHYDGKGYPEGLTGEQIPLSARIVAVADVFDALTNVRPYKGAYSFEMAWEMISSGKGSHFDPIIIESLARHFDSFRGLYEKLKTV
jgi:HD-GYP domain-containing protein (c-di-GMP phosphodiesterase class II)